MTASEFGTLHPKDYWAAVSAYMKAEDSRQIYIGELIRGMAFRIVMPFIKNKNRLSIHKFWHMPWDKDKDVEVEKVISNKESRKKSIKKLLERINGTKD